MQLQSRFIVPFSRGVNVCSTHSFIKRKCIKRLVCTNCHKMSTQEVFITDEVDVVSLHSEKKTKQRPLLLTASRAKVTPINSFLLCSFWMKDNLKIQFKFHHNLVATRLQLTDQVWTHNQVLSIHQLLVVDKGKMDWRYPPLQNRQKKMSLARTQLSAAWLEKQDKYIMFWSWNSSSCLFLAPWPGTSAYVRFTFAFNLDINHMCSHLSLQGCQSKKCSKPRTNWHTRHNVEPH